jgi:hypothetical protein
MLVDDGLEEVAQHLLGHVEVGDDAVLQRPHSEDAVGRAPQHPLGLEPDALDLARGLLDRHDGGLVQHDALTPHVHEGVRRPEIDGDFIGGDERTQAKGTEGGQLHPLGILTAIGWEGG